uniref:DUF4220 domain-containing protein n=2 Tax=Oryza TaxID=4527 RepID=A0A0D3G720_9ORYZ
MEQVDTKTIVQQFKDWEIQILVLLSFALQLLLFFFGGLRRRTSRAWLRIFLWLTYLPADFIAVYALGYLSRHLPTTANDHICCQTCPGKTLLPSQIHHDFTLLWAPFFLVHLGGQDTVTAFAIEDNELWSRHLLNMIVQITLFKMHLYTDMYLYKVSRQLDTIRSSGRDDDIQEKEVHSLMHTCEVISDYMFFLLVTQPAMLPVQRNVYDLLALVLNDASYARTSSKEQFLEALASGENPWVPPFMDNLFGATPDDMLEQLQQGWQGLHAALQVIVQVWVRLLIYAAGKSQPEEHARRLSMGGELLTFVWLLMAHRELGDIYNIQFQLVEKEKDGSVRTGPNSTITTDIYTLFRLGHPIDIDRIVLVAGDRWSLWTLIILRACMPAPSRSFPSCGS